MDYGPLYGFTSRFPPPSLTSASGVPTKMPTSLPENTNPEVVLTPEQNIQTQVLGTLNACKILTEILDFQVDGTEEDRKLGELREKLPQRMKDKIEDHTPNGLKKFAKTQLEEIGIKGSEDLGGHGGTRLAKIQVEGGTRYVFLKPLDPVEAKNYKLIQALSQELAKYMPKIYGEVEIGGKKYLAMENTRINESGEKLEQLADIKLAGKIKGEGLNPIYQPKETKVTRPRNKNPVKRVLKEGFKKIHMDFAAFVSPNFMLAEDSNKLVRQFKYMSSKEILQKKLEGTGQEHLNRLGEQLRAISDVMKNSPVALIGASIILIQNPDGSIKPLLIDPAHMQIKKSEEKQVNDILPPNEQGAVYYVEEEKFNLQRESNQVALDSLKQAVISKRVDRVATVCLEDFEGINEFPDKEGIQSTVRSSLGEIERSRLKDAEPSSPDKRALRMIQKQWRKMTAEEVLSALNAKKRKLTNFDELPNA